MSVGPSSTARHRTDGVLHVLAPAAFGGLERVVLALAGGQRARGARVSVAALVSSGEEPALLSELRTAGVTVHCIVTPGRSYALQIRRLGEIVQTDEPTVIHSHGYLADVLLGVMRRRIPFVRTTTVHGFTGGDWKNRLYEWLQVQAQKRFDAVVAVSEPIQERLVRAGMARSKVHVVRNALPPTRDPEPPAAARAQLGIPAESFSVGWVGRLSQEKGLDVLIDALQFLRDIPFHVSVVGNGQERSRLESLARERGVNDRTRFAGIVPESGPLMRAFDVLVLSSRTEGTPITLLEAMHASVPVVATSVGGIPHVISAREGLLVPPERPDLLAQAIRQIHSDPGAAAERAARARTTLQTQFARDPWIDAYDRIYRQAHHISNLAP